MTGVLVTPRSLSKGHPALEALTLRGFQFVTPARGAIPDEATLSAALLGCVGWLAGVEPVSPAVIDAADRLHVISRNGTGIDNLPLSVREQRQIRLFRAKGTNARGVAELALCLTFAGLRHIVRTHEGMRTGNWVRRLGRTIAVAKNAVIGLGAVGATYARMCLDLVARVLRFDPFAPDERLDHPGFARTILDHALVGSEVVSLRIPMPEDGRPLLTAEQLSLLAPDAVVLHTAMPCLYRRGDGSGRARQRADQDSRARCLRRRTTRSLDPDRASGGHSDEPHRRLYRCLGRPLHDPGGGKPAYGTRWPCRLNPEPAGPHRVNRA
jgi:D-3-phosphoglycerate dehydrogenase / 2-oxoglutarate reductase